MNRREAMQTITTAGVAAAASGVSKAKADTGTSLHPTVHGPRIHQGQAEKILDQLGLDALVLGGGANFQYLTGHRAVVSRMGYEPWSAAIFARRKDQPISMVTPAFSYYYTMSETHAPADVAVYAYSQPMGVMNEGKTEAPPSPVWPDRGEAPQTPIHKARAAAVQRVIEERGNVYSFEQALNNALTDLKLDSARIATDSTSVAQLLASAAPKATVVGAEDALRRIRPIKSAVEIELMRYAAGGNASAALDAVKLIKPGMTHRELRAEFFAAAGRRGHRGVFMVIDGVSEELYEGALSEGQSILIDCVSEYQGYHGDYGRTVFIGEPAKSMRHATAAVGDAWDKVRSALKPGLKFSDIRALGQTALKNAGKRYQVPFSAHSVGMYHSDHVGSVALPPREDIVVEPGMILSIDCPLTESGVGGSAHLEDLMLITENGSEPINDTSNQVIQV